MSNVRTGDVLDEGNLSALREFGREPGVLLQEMARDFLVEAPSLMAEIEEAVGEGEYATAGRAAHRLKGASGHMGATRVAAVASEVESLSKDGISEAMASATTTARAEVELALAAVRMLERRR